LQLGEAATADHFQKPASGAVRQAGKLDCSSSDDKFDGVSVRVYRQNPAGGASGVFPAVIYFHGGGWAIGSIGISQIVLNYLRWSMICLFGKFAIIAWKF